VRLHDIAADVVRRTLEAAPAPGGGRVLCVDGPAGSGKTTLAEAVAVSAPPDLSTRVVHMDDLYPGWDGLEDGVARVGRALVRPLAWAEPGGYRRYDWHEGREAEWVEVAPVDLMVLEGVGSGALAHAEHVSLLVWVDAPPDVRRARWQVREGGTEHLAAWAAAEDEHHARNRTLERADLEVSGDW
jgi:hypothetical protein